MRSVVRQDAKSMIPPNEKLVKFNFIKIKNIYSSKDTFKGKDKYQIERKIFARGLSDKSNI